MKLTHVKIFCALAAWLAGAAGAVAQSNGVPGPTDYAAFSRFITTRNIFDPNRQPHSYTANYRPRSRTRPRSNSAPAITLVGTMTYDKGMFAFFNGNSAELKKVLQASEKIADYTVTEVTVDGVKLESPDKKEVDLRIGDGLRQENGKWEFASAGELPAMSMAPETSNADSSGGASENAAPTAPTSAGEPNDVLKKLMEQREKENQ